jgi:hypothetical protein
MNPTQEGYSSTGESVVGNLEHPTGPSLPFTGMDIGLFAGAAFVLVAVGVALRRLTTAR